MTDKAQHPNPQVTPADSMDKNVFFKTILTTYSNDNVRCFMVDGSAIRDPLTKPYCLDFTEGDNHMHNPDMVPPGEIWVDLDVAPTEVRAVILHELTERRAMIEKGVDYETAHNDFANPAEEFARSHRDQLDELVLAELAIAPPTMKSNTEATVMKSDKKMVYKSFRANVIKYDDATGVIDMEIPMNSGLPDRSDEVCTPKSWEKRLPIFMKRPILVSSHTYDDLRKQIGEFVSLRVTDKGLMGSPKYYVNDGNQEADWAYKLAKRGMAAFSVGFQPIEYETAQKDGDPKITYTDSELLEISQVVVPCDRNAIQNSIGKSVGLEKDIMTEVLADKELIIPAKKNVTQAEIKDEIDYLKEMVSEVGLSPENKAEIRRLTGGDIPDINIKMSQSAKDIVMNAIAACDKALSVTEGHHAAHGTAYTTTRDIVLGCKKDLSGLIPAPQMACDEDKTFEALKQALDKSLTKNIGG